MKHIRIYSALCIAVGFASCNQGGIDPTMNDGGSAGVWTIPSVGTKYIYQISQMDATAKFDTITTINTGEDDHGGTNVVRYAKTYPNRIDTGFYNYESNGNFSFGDSILGPPGVAGGFKWTAYPTGSRKTIADPGENTFQDNEHIVSSSVRSFIGTENITTFAGSFSTLHVKETGLFAITDSAEILVDSSSTIYDYWFAPSIGLFVKETDSEIVNGQVTADELDLIKYIPR